MCFVYRQMAVQALSTDFPPSRMVGSYDEHWRSLNNMPSHTNGAPAMRPVEAQFFSSQVTLCMHMSGGPL